MAPLADPALWGVLSIGISVAVLALGVVCAWTATPDETDLPVPLDTEQDFTYTCHCYRDPIRVTVRRARSQGFS